MAQDGGDPIIANGQESLSVSRPKIVDGVKAVRSQHSGASAPTVTADHMIWADTAADVVKQRTAADDAWRNLWQEDAGPLANIPYAKTADFTVDQPGIYYVDTTGGNVIATIPEGSAAKGWFVGIVRESGGGNSLTVARSGSDTIEGATSVSMPSQYDKLFIFGRGTATWFKLSGLL